MAKQNNITSITDLPETTDWIAIFRASTVPQLRFHEGKPVVVQVTVDAAQVQEIADNYDANWQMACIWVGHEDPTQEALAWVSELKAENGVLYCKLTHISPELVEKINSKKYLYVSVELYNYEKDGVTLKYLGAIALTNLPLIHGLPKLNFTTMGKIAASRTFMEAIQCENNIKNLFENLNDKSTMDKNTPIGKFAESIGLRVYDYSTEQGVLDAAADIVNKLRAKFTDPNEQPCSLDMFLAKCDAKLERITALESDLKASKEAYSKIEDERIDFVIKAAVEADILLPAQEEGQRKLLKADFNTASEMLLSKAPNGILSAGVIKNGAPEGSDIPDDIKNTPINEIPKERLTEIKASHPAVYARKWKEHYGEDLPKD